MKKTLEIIGLSVLICFSFILTDKTSNFIKNKDNIMTTIKEQSELTRIDSVDAIIKDNEAIPGIAGKIIDIDESYSAMKKKGIYHTSLIVYKDVEPNISIKKQYDKYIIGGNSNKKMVSLIFKVKQNNNNNINNIRNVLDNYKVGVNFFIDGKWLEENKDNIKELVKNNNIGSLGYSESYSSENNYWLDTTIKSISKQKNYYCYTENKNNEVINRCEKNKNYTIIPKTVISDNLLLNIKKNSSNGSIIAIEINDNTTRELANSLEYLKSKGLNIVNLDTLLKE